MSLPRRLALGFLLLIFGTALCANLVARRPYAEQYREAVAVGPSAEFPLGTDSLGRDRFSRLLYGTRSSLLLAPAAALIATVIATSLGGFCAFLGGTWDRGFAAFTDAFISLPWFFVLITIRALLPLNVEPITSAVITFALLGLLGWPMSARIIRTGTRTFLTSDCFLQARASGIETGPLLYKHLGPNLRPLVLAQFLISIPVFILSEANLSLLGLGVAEPLPSWGSLLRELESLSAFTGHPVVVLPAVLLVAVVSCFQLLLQHPKEAT